MPDSFDKLPETLDTLWEGMSLEGVERYTKMVEEGEIVEDLKALKGNAFQ